MAIGLVLFYLTPFTFKLRRKLLSSWGIPSLKSDKGALWLVDLWLISALISRWPFQWVMSLGCNLKPEKWLKIKCKWEVDSGGKVSEREEGWKTEKKEGWRFSQHEKVVKGRCLLFLFFCNKSMTKKHYFTTSFMENGERDESLLIRG